ncbi:MAG: LEA type 2 family protein, partial [Bacteroidetes bacterium]|nr:LEA type 2 family protein [Bacteroidota bacterium]
MKTKFSICILLLLIFATSCQSPKDLEFRNVQNITLDNLSFNDATLKMELVYYNPNNYGLELNRTDFDIYVNENLLGHSLQDLQLKIPSRKEFTVPV